MSSESMQLPSEERGPSVVQQEREDEAAAAEDCRPRKGVVGGKEGPSWLSSSSSGRARLCVMVAMGPGAPAMVLACWVKEASEPVC